VNPVSSTAPNSEPINTPTTEATELLLEARHLTKRFGSMVANDDVSFTLAAGEIHALLGENGAGKSTLVKMLFGIYSHDAGEIAIRGQVVNLRGPRDAIDRGMGMVHQHFQLVPVMTVAENVILGAETVHNGRLDLGKAEARVRELSERYGLAVDPTAVVEDLPVGTQQRVEIIKALYRGAEILILDEPTAVLTPAETDELLGIMRALAAQGTGIIFITHKLREVLAVAHRISVLRQGRLVGTTTAAESDEAALANMMVGRSVVLHVHKDVAQPGAEVLSVTGLQVDDDRGHRTVRGVDLSVHAGEILGIAGVEGNGQRELVEALCGMRKVHAGSVTIDGRVTTGFSPHAMNRLGIAHIPQDREKHGLVGTYSVADNLVLERFDEEPFAVHGIRHRDAVDSQATQLVERFDIRPTAIDNPAQALSGGNKQKVIVARELSQNAHLLIAAQPTRGVDVGSIEFIHTQLVAQRDAGVAVLLVSAELDEILSLSDRVAVMYEGRVQAVLPIAEATRERIGLLMAGAGSGSGSGTGASH
jgi:general nucleoside transport system ATP-binding protein